MDRSYSDVGSISAKEINYDINNYIVPAISDPAATIEIKPYVTRSIAYSSYIKVNSNESYQAVMVKK
jgi:hypothetical protein